MPRHLTCYDIHLQSDSNVPSVSSHPAHETLLLITQYWPGSRGRTGKKTAATEVSPNTRASLGACVYSRLPIITIHQWPFALCTPELGLTEFKCLDELACHVGRDGMVAFEDDLSEGGGRFSNNSPQGTGMRTSIQRLSTRHPHRRRLSCMSQSSRSQRNIPNIARSA